MKILIPIALLIGATSAAKDHCYALAMAGGGSRGAYELGVMWGMYYAAKDKSEY